MTEVIHFEIYGRFAESKKWSDMVPRGWKVVDIMVTPAMAQHSDFLIRLGITHKGLKNENV